MKLLGVLLSIWIGAAALLAQQAPESTADGLNAAVSTKHISDITAAQVMLDRAGFSPGEIDGRAGPNVARAIAAFQRVHGLSPSGAMSPPTWERLREVTGHPAPVVPYDIGASDIAGPFSAPIPSDLVQQAKLPALGYQDPLEAIAERFHASPGLLKTLNPTASFQRAGERIFVPNVEPFELSPADAQSARGRNGRRGESPAGTPGAKAAAHTVFVTESTSALTVEDGSGGVLFHAPVTTGSERDPLPIGTWTVTGVHPMPTFHYNPDLFWDADPSHSKATIKPGPNNPVGVAWIDLSKEHYGIHGTPQPSRIGHVQSHGCVRLTNWDVQRLLNWVRPGTRVVFRR